MPFGACGATRCHGNGRVGRWREVLDQPAGPGVCEQVGRDAPPASRPRPRRHGHRRHRHGHRCHRGHRRHRCRRPQTPVGLREPPQRRSVSGGPGRGPRARCRRGLRAAPWRPAVEGHEGWTGRCGDCPGPGGRGLGFLRAGTRSWPRTPRPARRPEEGVCCRGSRSTPASARPRVHVHRPGRGLFPLTGADGRAPRVRFAGPGGGPCARLWWTAHVPVWASTALVVRDRGVSCLVFPATPIFSYDIFFKLRKGYSSI